MESDANKKIIWIGAGVTILLLAAVFVGPGIAASYFYKKGVELYFQDNSGGAHFAEAKKNFERSLGFDSENAPVHMYLGRIALGRIDEKTEEYYPEADWESAIPHYEKALELSIERQSDNWYGHTLENLGLSYLKTGQYEKARQMYLRKIERFPDAFFGIKHLSTFWPRLLTAEMDFERFNKPEEARDLLLPISEPENADPKNIYRVYILLARLSAYFNDWENAERYAKLALDVLPAESGDKSRGSIHSILALAAGKNRNFSLAQKELDVLRGFGDSAQLECIRANAYLVGESYRNARDIAARVEKPDAASYRYSFCLRILAESHKALGNAAEARKFFKEYLDYTAAIDPKNIFIMRSREQAESETK